MLVIVMVGATLCFHLYQETFHSGISEKHLKLKVKTHNILYVQDRSDPLYIVTYYKKWVATSWTYSMYIHYTRTTSVS